LKTQNATSAVAKPSAILQPRVNPTALMIHNSEAMVNSAALAFQPAMVSDRRPGRD
jgi:hypothetical protein